MASYRFRAPRWVPELAELLRELGADARSAAKHLEVSERTVYHWLASGRAPRAARLALWFETHAGLSCVACEAANAAQVHRALTQSLERENAMLRGRIDRLEALADFGCANAPTLDAASLGTVRPRPATGGASTGATGAPGR